MLRKGAIIISLVVTVIALTGTSMTFSRWQDSQQAYRGVRAELIALSCDPGDVQRYGARVAIRNVSEQPIIVHHMFSRLLWERTLLSTFNLTHQDLVIEPGQTQVYDMDFPTRLKPELLPPATSCESLAEWEVNIWLEIGHPGYRGVYRFTLRARHSG